MNDRMWKGWNGMTLGFLGVYLALAAIFYIRLTATATNIAAPKIKQHFHWHRARHLTESFLRRVRPSLPKH
ncbi:MAG: hypothetical protein ACRYFS_18730 [Janthinobacterium lividum]